METRRRGAIAPAGSEPAELLGWYRRRLRTSTRERASGIVVVQRASSDLKLNPHLHVVFLDGVYAATAEGTPAFRALPHLSTIDVADALGRARILRYRKRRDVIRADEAALSVETLAERIPHLHY